MTAPALPTRLSPADGTMAYVDAVFLLSMGPVYVLVFKE